MMTVPRTFDFQLPLRRAALLLAFALPLAPAEARIVIDSTSVFASIHAQVGPAANPVVIDRFVSASPAMVQYELPVFTPPRGAPGDTLFSPAELRATQLVEGINATAVSGAFANGLTRNRLESLTSWTLFGHLVPTLLVPLETLRLQYMLFAGDLGLSRFGDYDGEVGVSMEIVLTEGPVERFRLESELALERHAGSIVPTLRSSAPLSDPGLVLGATVIDGLSYDTLHVDPQLGEVNLGQYGIGPGVELTYTMRAWVEVPGLEIGGFARLGDPFGLANDPDAALARAFPGAGRNAFGLSTDAAPQAVPLPGTLALVLAVALPLGAAGRRRGG